MHLAVEVFDKMPKQLSELNSAPTNPLHDIVCIKCLIDELRFGFPIDFS